MKILHHFRAKLIALALVSLLALALLFFEILIQHQHLIDSQRSVSLTLQVREETNALLLNAIDGSNAVRGYVIAGNPAYLAPYEHMRTTLMPQFEKLDKLIRDSTVQYSTVQYSTVQHSTAQAYSATRHPATGTPE